VQKVVHWRP